MVEKIKINETGDCIFTEQDAIDLLYTNPDFDISKLFFELTEQYNNSIKDTGLDLQQLQTVPKRPTPAKVDETNIANWFMPQKYYELNVLEWLLNKCQNDTEKKMTTSDMRQQIQNTIATLPGPQLKAILAFLKRLTSKELPENFQMQAESVAYREWLNEDNDIYDEVFKDEL